MKKDELNRNRPAEEGKNNDPNLRDYAGQQPGASTISTSRTDEANQELTETAKDGFNENKPDERADATLDEPGETI